MNDILINIENLRWKLTEYVISKGVADSEVLALSEQLDMLLNEYDRYRFSKKG